MPLRTIVGGVLGLTVLLVPSVGATQTAGPAVNLSSVVRGGVVVVSYDLMSTDPNAVFSVALEASSDGGKTYTVHPRTVKGDVGAAVRPGTGKQITWEAARDVESLEVDRFRYRVNATAPTGRAAATTTGNQPSMVKSGGKGRLWTAIGLMGGGGFLAVAGYMDTQTVPYCDYYYDCIYEDKRNNALMWTGIAAAGGGAALLAFGGHGNSSRATEVVVGPGSVAVRHRLRIPRFD
jgi:hypothetical protein